MKLIAISENVDVFSPSGSVRVVPFGQFVGDLKTNSNDGFLVLTTGEKVDIDAVAIDTTQTANSTNFVEKVPFEQNQPIQGEVAKINGTTAKEERNKRTRKIIAIGLTVGGIYFFFNGRKSIGITMFIFGLIMLKRNSKLL